MRAEWVQFGRLGSVVIAALLVAGCVAPAPQRAPTGAAREQPASAPAPTVAAPVKVHAAFVALAGAMLPAWLAADRGLFQRYGLDVELTYISGLAKIAESLIAGELDFGISPTPTAMGPGLQGADLVAIACWSTKNAFSLFAQPSITSVEDLRGKRVATSRRGSLTELWAAEVLSRYGLEPERDYIVVPLGGQPEQLAGLQNGAVDASALAVPTNVLARKLGFREILSYRDAALEYASLGVITSRRLLADRSEVAEQFLKAIAEGVAMMLQDTDAAMAVLAERMKIDDPEMLMESLEFDRYRTVRDMMPTLEGLQAAMDSLAVNNPATLGADPTKYVDLTLIRKLNDEGFIDSLYR